MDAKELIKKVKRIEIKTRRLSNDIFSGEYHSSFKGRGMTFSEVRRYDYGDSIKDIDWNVTAKLNKPHVKIFEEERELTTILLVDISASGNFGTTDQLKRDNITEICATLAFSASQNNDKVGLILFSDIIELFVPPKKGKKNVLRIIRELVEFSPKSKKTDIAKAIKFLSEAIKKRSIVFILSDFMDDYYEVDLKVASKKHDIVGIKVYDKREKVMPDLGMVDMLDSETGEHVLINTSSRGVRRSYRDYFLSKSKYFKDTFTSCKAGNIESEISESYVKKLLEYFKQKR
ncbi:DUF58 domain-containing protein [Ichthyobacterium seriolicida]|uniref:DUF58 domain-containing protein n=1 Tax=Ichthyobacterium seriolicida TaxID=242600 RepID=A0A1J1DYH0_9FLAO|nr:DUF58 domain-containing protein [Ichthyobacterium seriolicida]BAV94921.1 hypothetical protein JBKA6_0908 [Ichthyobacterium seriolicida]